MATKSKNINPLREVYENSGREYEYTNRNRAVKNLNELINSGAVELKLNKVGMVWVTKSGFKYNLNIKGFGFGKGFLIHGSHDITPLEILTCVGKFFNYKDVKEVVSSQVSDNRCCSKCNGKGIIPQFHYYCQGICFDCYGTGHNKKPTYTVKANN